jgi:hypothetical protein
VILGIVAIVYANKQNRLQRSGKATAGIVTGIIGLVFSSFWMIMWTFAFIGMIVGTPA